MHNVWGNVGFVYTLATATPLCASVSLSVKGKTFGVDLFSASHDGEEEEEEESSWMFLCQNVN